MSPQFKGRGYSDVAEPVTVLIETYTETVTSL